MRTAALRRTRFTSVIGKVKFGRRIPSLCPGACFCVAGDQQCSCLRWGPVREPQPLLLTCRCQCPPLPSCSCRPPRLSTPTAPSAHSTAVPDTHGTHVRRRALILDAASTWLCVTSCDGSVTSSTTGHLPVSVLGSTGLAFPDQNSHGSQTPSACPFSSLPGPLQLPHPGLTDSPPILGQGTPTLHPAGQGKPL